jgi:dephospho-CoA kinase
MPVWGWILIAAMVVVVAVVIVVAISASRRTRTARLKERFGPEYERTVFEAGEQKAAEKELAARERKRDKLDILPLAPEALQEYANRWRKVQTAFVDNPSSAVGDADRLVTEVMHERGYPVDDFDQQAADISVDQPGVVENYRAAHGIHLLQQKGDVGTEQQRQAFVHYRALFEKLLESEKDKASHRRQAHDNPRSTH